MAWRTAITQRYNISLSQKSSQSNHFASFNYEHDKNRALNDNSNNFSIYLKSNFKLAKWLDIKLGIDTRLSNSTSPEGSYTSYTLQERYASIVDAQGNRVQSPYVNLGGYVGSSVNGTRIREVQEQQVDGLMPFTFNVLDALDESLTKSRNVRLRPFVNVEAKFLKMFRYNVMFQYEWAQTRSEQYDGPDTYQMRMTHNAFIDQSGECLLSDGGRFFQQTNNSRRYTFRNQLSFDKSFLDAKHNVNAIMAAYLTLVVPRLFSFVTMVHWQNLLAVMLPYTLACIFFGMLVSCLVRYRENVMLLVVFVSVPLLFLTGVSWPQSNIPSYWQGISWLFPSTFGVRAFVRMNTMGATLDDVAFEYRALWIQALCYFMAACILYRHQIILSRHHALERLERIGRKLTVVEQIRKKARKGA